MRRNQVKGAKKMRRRPPRPHRADRKHLMDLGGAKCRPSHSRRYDLWPGRWNDQMGGHPWARIDLRIARSRKWMLWEAGIGGSASVANDPCTLGCVLSVRRRRVCGHDVPVRACRGRIAQLLLNEQDLLRHPSELIAHECTHAAMRFMETRGVRPSDGMASEEALAYTVGELVKQANRIFYAHAFRQGST